MKININDYPTQLANIYLEIEKSDDYAAKHKLLLDLGENFLTYLTGIMFGEYKRNGEILKKLEVELYKKTGRNLSFGVYLSFLRDYLSSGITDSILADKFTKNKKYEQCSLFIFEFNIIKDSIDSGIDEGFTDGLESKRKGRTIGKKTLIDFFDTFIRLRNILAHPEEKAGPKNNKRRWPLGSEYYKFINPLLQSALEEIITDFEILKFYKPVIAKSLDEQNNKARFLLEVGKKGKEFDKEISVKKLNAIITDTRYLIDQQNEIYVKLFKSIPAVDTRIAKEIIKEEKSKLFEPHLLEIIHSKLSDDGRIDEMEYLVLKDTANSAFISTEKLFKLIDKKRKELQIDATVGTPENKGSVFIQVKDDVKKISFNPWWMYYLSMLPKTDKNVVKKEKDKVDTLKAKIEKLKESKKEISVYKQIEIIKKKIKARKDKKKSLNTKNKVKISKKREQIKKASKAELKEKYQNELLEIRNGLKDKLEKLENEFVELNKALVSNEKLLVEKKTEIDNNIAIAVHEFESYFMMTRIGMHKNLWNEINQYVNQIIQDHLEVKKTEELEDNENFDDENSSVWENSPNNWIIGELAHTYWGKIYPKQGALGRAYNIGYAVSNKFKWVPHKNNTEESLLDAINKPSTLVWTTTDDKWVAKIDLDGSITEKREELNMELIEKYKNEFLSMGVNVRCHLPDLKSIDAAICDEDVYFMTLKKFLKEKGKYSASSIYSRIWTIDLFYNNGELNLESIAQYEREMTALITIFSNSLITLNDYALENGVNQDTIEERFDLFNRAKKYLLEEVQKIYPIGKKFTPVKEEIDQWRILLKEKFDLNDYLFDRAFEAVRWIINSNGKSPIKKESKNPKS